MMLIVERLAAAGGVFGAAISTPAASIAAFGFIAAISAGTAESPFATLPARSASTNIRFIRSHDSSPVLTGAF